MLWAPKVKKEGRQGTLLHEVSKVPNLGYFVVTVLKSILSVVVFGSRVTAVGE